MKDIIISDVWSGLVKWISIFQYSNRIYVHTFFVYVSTMCTCVHKNFYLSKLLAVRICNVFE